MSINITRPPLTKLKVTSNFGIRNGRPHRGTDFGWSAYDSEDGIEIYAVSDGIVKHTAYDSDGYGYYTVLQHNGYCTLYAHMQGNLRKVGENITAGTVLGYMGNTGGSDGTHLHFEIRKGLYSQFWDNPDRITIDPMTVLNAGSLTDTDEGVARDESVVDPLSSGALPMERYSFVYGEYESSANISTQPYHAFVDLWIGNTHVPQIPPQYLIGCDVTLLSDKSVSDKGSAVSVILTLFDKYCDQLEYLFYKNQRNVTLRFGHVSGRQSTTLYLIVQTYSINFNPKGNTLIVNLISNGEADSSTLATFVAGDSPSDAVRGICSKMGWREGLIEHSVQLVGQGEEPVTFALINDNPIQYIRKEIAPRAIRARDGKGGFQFHLDTSTSPPIAHFHPIDLKEGGLKTYVYQKGKNSPVIDFTLTSTLSFATSALASEYRASGIDPLTKEEFNYTYKRSDMVVDASVDTTPIKDEDNPVVLDTEGSSPDEISANVSYRFTTHLNGIEGTLTLVGDPSLSINDQIRLIILNDDITMHSTSGIYYVKNVNHNIRNGTMITTALVVKEGNIADAEVKLSSAKIVR